MKYFKTEMEDFNKAFDLLSYPTTMLDETFLSERDFRDFR